MSLTEHEAIQAFHQVLQRALSICIQKGIIPKSDVADAEPSMILAAPALTLYMGAVGALKDAKTGEYTIPLSTGKVMDSKTCPEGELRDMFCQWQAICAQIQALSEPNKDLLIKFLTDKLNGALIDKKITDLGTVLNGIGIRITQRHTFQHIFFKTDIPLALKEPTAPVPTEAPVMISLRETLFAVMAEVMSDAKERKEVLQGATEMTHASAARVLATGILCLVEKNLIGRDIWLVTPFESLLGQEPVRTRKMTEEDCPLPFRSIFKALFQIQAFYAKATPAEIAFVKAQIQNRMARLPTVDAGRRNTFPVRQLLQISNVIVSIAHHIVQLPKFQEYAPEAFRILMFT